MCHFKPHVLLAMLILALMLNGCATIPVKPESAASPQLALPESPLLASANAPVPDEADIFALAAYQQTEFLEYFNSPEHQSVAKHRRIYNFLAEHLSNFSYTGENYTASEAFTHKSGNCISLAVLTKALADLVDVTIEFQVIVSAPVYSIESNFMLSSDHVRAFLYDPDFVGDKGVSYFSKPAIIIDYLPSGTDITGPRVSERTFIAMFYRNLAADSLLQGDYNRALAILRTALNYAPRNAAVINLIAVIHRQLAHQVMAEQYYLYGLEVADSKTTLKSNYAVLKQSLGETLEAEAILQSLMTSDEHDPYRWYILGKDAFKQQHYRDAVSFYHKAIAQAPYLHQFHFELALSYYKLNQPRRARQALEKAAELSAFADQQQRYNAKLEALQKVH